MGASSSSSASKRVQDDAPFQGVTPPAAVPTAPRYPTRHVDVLGKRMAYVEVAAPPPPRDGDGGSYGGVDTIVFVHGNPTNKYMWRNVMPHCADLGCRLLAPDLIGMGESDKLENYDDPDRYAMGQQSRYFGAFLAAVGVTARVWLVGHSWGGTLCAHWGSQHPDAVRGLVTAEVVYVPFPTWERVPKKIRGGVKLLKRTKKVCCCCCAFDVGAKLLLEKNLMIESMKDRVNRPLADEEMRHYRQPFLEPGEPRRPILSFVRSIPVAGDPKDVVDIMGAGRAWLEASDLPKLFLSVQPGTMMEGDRDFVRGLKNVTEVPVAAGHMVTEDSPDAVGQAIAQWYRETTTGR